MTRREHGTGRRLFPPVLLRRQPARLCQHSRMTPEGVALFVSRKWAKAAVPVHVALASAS